MSEQILNAGTTITFTQKDYDALKAAYSQAVAKKQEEFLFYQHTMLTTYAKYLIEYLSSQFK